MTTNLVRAMRVSLCAGLLTFAAMPSAFAMHGSTILVSILAITVKVQKDGVTIDEMQTDANGKIILKDLVQGHYTLVIDGPELAKATSRVFNDPNVDRLPSPSTKSSSGGVGKSIPIGGNGGNSGSNPPGVKTGLVGILIGGGSASPIAPVSVNVPYCRDAFAGQDIRVGFTAPPGAPATVVMTIFDRWGNL